MRDFVVTPEAAAKLNPFQRPHHLAAEDGGGVVFPNGFFGPGYYLPEWEYLRYRTMADHHETNPDTLTWWQRHILRPSLIGSLFSCGAVWIVGRLVDELTDGSQTLNVLSTGIAAYGSWWVYRRFREQPRQMQEAFPSSKQLAPYRYWRAHVTEAMMDAGPFAYLSYLANSVIAAFVLLLLFALANRDALHPVFAVTNALPFLIPLLYQPLILASAQTVRLRLGRVPTRADLHPVDPPA